MVLRQAVEVYRGGRTGQDWTGQEEEEEEEEEEEANPASPGASVVFVRIFREPRDFGPAVATYPQLSLTLRVCSVHWSFISGWKSRQHA